MASDLFDTTRDTYQCGKHVDVAQADRARSYGAC
jgi:hypothetical protein